MINVEVKVIKVLLYTEAYGLLKKSGIGQATEHIIREYKLQGINYTLDKDELKNVDLIHINYYGLESFLLAKKAHRLGKKVIYHAHSNDRDFKKSFILSNLLAPIFKLWICNCYRQGDVIITPSEYAKTILEAYKLGRNIKVLSNGIDLEKMKRNIDGGEEFRKKYNIRENEKVIISVGLYLERKGLLDFVSLAKELPQYKFIWFGYSPFILAPKKIKEVLKNYPSNMIYAGYVSQEELVKAYSGCDLFLFLSYEETEGIALLEALSAKADVLIRDIPIYKELEEGKDVYKGDNMVVFKNKIEGILQGNLPSLREAGYKYAKSRDIKNVSSKLKDIYDEVLDKEKL